MSNEKPDHLDHVKVLRSINAILETSHRKLQYVPLENLERAKLLLEIEALVEARSEGNPMLVHRRTLVGEWKEEKDQGE
jgi:hypothetical protein